MTEYEHDEAQPAQPAGRARFRPDHVAGWVDLVGHAIKETAPRIHRTHLQIADTVFRQVGALAPAQPAVRITQTMHHLIAHIAYTSVGYGGAGLSHLARLRYRPVSGEREIRAPLALPLPGPRR